MARILVVDDKEENRYYLESLLGGHGHTVVCAHHGAEALDIARAAAFDLAVSDLLMPVMDGYTLLQHWKADPALKSVPFLVYTATYTEPEDQQLALRLGCDAFILKPCEPEQLIEAVSAVLGSSPRVPAGDPAPGADTRLVNDPMQGYSGILVRKLEEKMLELEEANRKLAEDVERRKQAEIRIEQLAFYDTLTGLPNRRLMEDRLRHCMATSKRLGLWGAALFIDLDNFKTLNDSRGHDVGDRFLVNMAERLQKAFMDEHTVCRFSGDEFVVILESLSADEEQAASMTEATAERLMERLGQPCEILDDIYQGSASIGITLFRDRESVSGEVIRKAEAAMYQAKYQGRNSFRFFDPDMQATLESRLQLELDLRNALQEKQFCLFYQPLVNSRRTILGAEALLRWQSPHRGLVSPGDFIPVAEDSGLILPIGQWVLEQACDQLRQWDSRSSFADIQIAVNVSVHQFHQHDFVERVMNTLAVKQVDPSRLKLELTESVILNDVDAAIAKMQALRDRGVHFAMDDFGTGYSSLSYLTRLPLSQLKIDQSFIQGLGVNRGNEVVVQTIIGMAGSLGIEVIAEGVETEAQWRELEALGCRLFQGYYFARPQPIESFGLRKALLSAGNGAEYDKFFLPRHD